MTSKNNVKDLAFKLREKYREKRKLANGNKAPEVIDLEMVPSPTAKEPFRWASDLTTEDEKVLLTVAEWLTDRLINADQKLIKSANQKCVVYGMSPLGIGVGRC